MATHDLQQRIAAALGTDVVDAHPVGGGCINAAFRLALADGRTAFAKTHADAPADMFATEAMGLRALAAAEGGPPVPEVLLVEDDLLVLSWIEPGRLEAGGWAELGRALARMHRTTAPRFGFDADNFIGSTPQPNPWTEDGVAFFAEHRLGFQLRLAFDAGRLTKADLDRGEALLRRLPDLLPSDEPASLLHGDLWSGNVHPRADGVGCLVDPATWYGYREADVAMTRLFGSLPDPFYRGYEEVWPLPSGARSRRDLFNLYHLLNHLNLFGGGYRASVERVLRSFA